jgi:uncharacterized protein (UPF0303 family)
LQFVEFNETTAWQIGTLFIERAIKDDLPVTIDITRGSHQLFHASRPGTSPDNDEWIKRKVRVVYRFGHSSFYIGQSLISENTSMEKKYLLSEREFAAHGGSFPVFVKGCGLIGTITVSGLPQEQDHQLVVDVIRNYLQNDK